MTATNRPARRPAAVRDTLIRIPFHGHELLAIAENGALHIVLDLVLDRIGLDHWAQIAKLRTKPWATIRERHAQLPGDRWPLTYTTCDVRTFLMLLATVDERRVPADVAPILVTYQTEVAEAIETHWTRNGVVSPRAAEYSAIGVGRAKQQAEVLRALDGLVEPDWLETQARHLIARALGEPLVPAPTRAPLTVV